MVHITNIVLFLDVNMWKKILMKKWKSWSWLHFRKIEKYSGHINTDYHKFSHVATEKLFKVNTSEIEDVCMLLNLQRNRERKQN